MFIHVHFVLLFSLLCSRGGFLELATGYEIGADETEFSEADYVRDLMDNDAGTTPEIKELIGMVLNAIRIAFFLWGLVCIQVDFCVKVAY